MSLPHDLKNYRAERDAFQVIDPGDAVVGLLALAILAWILWPYICGCAR